MERHIEIYRKIKQYNHFNHYNRFHSAEKNSNSMKLSTEERISLLANVKYINTFLLLKMLFYIKEKRKII